MFSVVVAIGILCVVHCLYLKKEDLSDDPVRRASSNSWTLSLWFLSFRRWTVIVIVTIEMFQGFRLPERPGGILEISTVTFSPSIVMFHFERQMCTRCYNTVLSTLREVSSASNVKSIPNGVGISLMYMEHIVGTKGRTLRHSVYDVQRDMT